MRLPNERQLAAVFASLDRVSGQLDSLHARMSEAIEQERRHGGSHDGWGRGNKWTSSTEAAGIARAEGNYRTDPQRALLNRAVERLVRGTADLAQAEADLSALEAMQQPRTCTEALAS